MGLSVEAAIRELDSPQSGSSIAMSEIAIHETSKRDCRQWVLTNLPWDSSQRSCAPIGAHASSRGKPNARCAGASVSTFWSCRALAALSHTAETPD